MMKMSLKEEKVEICECFANYLLVVIIVYF